MDLPPDQEVLTTVPPPRTTTKVVEPTDKFTVLAVRGAIIGTGLLGLTFYVKNSRLFANYRHVSSIPKQYYQNEVLLKGVVREVTPTGLLKIEHKPIVSIARLFGRKSPANANLLKLRLAGVSVSPEGVTHMAKDLRLANRPVTFGVVKPSGGAEADAADGFVNVRSKFLVHTDLGVDLVRKGLARVLTAADDTAHVEALRQNANYARLVNRLLASERVAERRGIGVWERSTWVESLRSIPASAGQMLRAAAVTKLLILLFDVLRDLTLLLIGLLRQGYNLGVTVAGYTAGAYRSFARGVDRVAHFYVRLKSDGLRKTLGPASKK